MRSGLDLKDWTIRYKLIKAPDNNRTKNNSLKYCLRSEWILILNNLSYESELLKIIPIKRSTFYSWQSEWIANGNDPRDMGKLLILSNPKSKNL